MIKNEREYRITKAHLAGFEGGLTANDEREFPSNVDPGMKQLNTRPRETLSFHTPAATLDAALR